MKLTIELNGIGRRHLLWAIWNHTKEHWKPANKETVIRHLTHRYEKWGTVVVEGNIKAFENSPGDDILNMAEVLVDEWWPNEE